MNIMTMDTNFVAPQFCPFLDIRVHVFDKICTDLINSDHNPCTKTEIIKHHTELCSYGIVAEDDIIFNSSPDSCDRLLKILKWSEKSSYDYINLGGYIFDVDYATKTDQLILGEALHTHAVIYATNFCEYLTSVPSGVLLDWYLMKHSRRGYISTVPLFVQSPNATAKGKKHFTEELESYRTFLNYTLNNTSGQWFEKGRVDST